MVAGAAPRAPLGGASPYPCHVGRDDFPAEWAGFDIAERLPLEEIARAHELVEHPVRRGRVVLSIGERDGAADERGAR